MSREEQLALAEHLADTYPDRPVYARRVETLRWLMEHFPYEGSKILAWD